MAVSAAFAPGVLPTWSFQSCRSSVVEHPLGKGEVECSIHSGSTSKISHFLDFFAQTGQGVCHYGARWGARIPDHFLALPCGARLCAPCSGLGLGVAVHIITLVAVALLCAPVPGMAAALIFGCSGTATSTTANKDGAEGNPG